VGSGGKVANDEGRGWLEEGDEEDQRGRVGEGFPWEERKW